MKFLPFMCFALLLVGTAEASRAPGHAPGTWLCRDSLRGYPFAISGERVHQNLVHCLARTTTFVLPDLLEKLQRRYAVQKAKREGVEFLYFQKPDGETAFTYAHFTVETDRVEYLSRNRADHPRDMILSRHAFLYGDVALNYYRTTASDASTILATKEYKAPQAYEIRYSKTRENADVYFAYRISTPQDGHELYEYRTGPFMGDTVFKIAVIRDAESQESRFYDWKHSQNPVARLIADKTTTPTRYRYLNDQNEELAQEDWLAMLNERFLKPLDDVSVQVTRKIIAPHIAKVEESTP